MNQTKSERARHQKASNGERRVQTYWQESVAQQAEAQGARCLLESKTVMIHLSGKATQPAPKLTEKISFRETEETVARLTAFAARLGLENPNQAARIAFRAGLSAVETMVVEVRK